MNLKQWVNFKNAARRNKDINHWVASPSADWLPGGVVITGADLVTMIDAIDSARTLVRHQVCENTPMDCEPGVMIPQDRRPCDTCGLRWALAKVVEE